MNVYSLTFLYGQKPLHQPTIYSLSHMKIVLKLTAGHL